MKEILQVEVLAYTSVIMEKAISVTSTFIFLVNITFRNYAFDF